MPAPAHWWWHLILTTHGSWLPGDPRGFRNRSHRIHSSGDHQNPPPTGEHAGLYAEALFRSTRAKHIPEPCRWPLGEALLHELQTHSIQVLAIAVCGDHAHLLVELPDDFHKAKRWMGRLKQRSSHAMGGALTGKLWAKGGKPIRIKNQAHQQQVFHYILRHYDQGGWVWSFRDGPRDPSKS